MNIYKIATFLLVAIIGLSSCEEVIILDLENDEPKLVIEAVVDAKAESVSVLLTKSNGFYEDISLAGVNTATITLTLADGSAVNVPFVANGLYTATGITTAVNDALSITINDGEGNTYTASARTPNATTIDSLSTEEITFGPGSDRDGDNPRFRVFTYWQDLASVENYYRIRAFKNDTLQANIYTLVDDIGNDGNQIFRPFSDAFESGDVVRIQLLALDKSTFTYFSDLSVIQGDGPNSSSPFNPHSNFDNDALGYFGILQIDEQVMVIP